jgi:hypothetical protein
MVLTRLHEISLTRQPRQTLQGSFAFANCVCTLAKW